MEAAMRLFSMLQPTAVALVALAISGCGGGGGSEASPAATPLVASPVTMTVPTPMAPTPALVNASGSRFNLGLTQLADFPTYSWVYRTGSAAAPDPADRVEYGYDAARDTWSMAVPGGNRASLTLFPTETGYDYTGAFFNSGGGHALYTLTPGLQNAVLPLEATSVGYWGWSIFNSAARGFTSGALVYGVPTAAADMPQTGSGNYKLYGFAVSRPAGSTGDAHYDQIVGSASVDYATDRITGDFGAGAVPQSVFTASPTAERYTIADVQMSSDGTTFQGRLSVPGLAGEATYEGRFTGAGAREFMLRWKGPFRDTVTGKIETIYGALAGRRG
jgi:hypothetical protein